jgi:hypothetical protein
MTADEVAPTLTSDAHAVTDGSVVSFHHEEAWYVGYVIARRTDTAISATRGSVEEQLMREWLAERRAAATIDWDWSKSSRGRASF